MSRKRSFAMDHQETHLNNLSYRHTSHDETQLDVQAAGQPARRVGQGRPVTFIRWCKDTLGRKLGY